MSNGEVAVIKLRHHEKGPWLRKRRAEEEKSEDAPHSSYSVNLFSSFYLFSNRYLIVSKRLNRIVLS